MRPIALVDCRPEHAEIIAAMHADTLGGGWSAASVALLLRRPGGVGLIAADAGTDEPLGFILCLAAGDVLDIAALATIAPARRAGIARRLLAEASIRAATAGFDRMMLDVAERNAPALALYRSLGFAVLARRQRYYRDRADNADSDALVLEKNLGSSRVRRSHEEQTR